MNERKKVDHVIRDGDVVLLTDQQITYRREPQKVWWKRALRIRGPMVAVNNNGVWICHSHGPWTKPS